MLIRFSKKSGKIQKVPLKEKFQLEREKRLIVGHCGSSEKGLIKDEKLIFQTKWNDDNKDYHKYMNNNEFNK